MTPAKFDPKNPVPRKTEYYVAATGAGQADPQRLAVVTAVGAIGALAVAVFLRDWLGLATPFVCLAMFGVWGIAQQKLSSLVVAHDEAPGLRRTLEVVKTAAVTLGACSALLGIAALVFWIMHKE